jgi:hypothetical protein
MRNALAVVFQIGSLGDTVLSVPSLLSLRELLPDCTDYLLLSGFQGNKKVHPGQIFDMAWPAKQKLNYKAKGKRLECLLSAAGALARLRYYRPRYGVYLLPSARFQHQVDRDISFFHAGGVRELHGFRTLTPQERPLKEDLSKFTTESFLRFKRLWNEQAEEKYDSYCRSPLLQPPAAAITAVKTWLAQNRRKPEHALVTVCPFSNDTARDLEPSVVVSLLKKMESELRVETLLLGGGKDHTRIEQICLEAGTGLNACGVFSPSESAALFSQSKLAVCVDSGPLHLAGAVNIPTVVAYAVVNKPFHLFFPLGQNHTLLYQKVSCAGCGKTVCPVEGHPCMSRTTAEQIFQAIRDKLSLGSVDAGSLRETQVLAWPQVAQETLHAV